MKGAAAFSQQRARPRAAPAATLDSMCSWDMSISQSSGAGEPPGPLGTLTFHPAGADPLAPKAAAAASGGSVAQPPGSGAGACGGPA
jgi:hypothetical protein